MVYGSWQSARFAIVIAAAAVVIAGSWWFATRPGAAPIGVVVITLDTTRADRLSIYGNMDVTLPALERVSREGVMFDRATSVAPMTLPAHTSLFTGLLPPHHGVRDNATAPLGESHTTLAELLRADGFKTGAFVSSVVVGPERGLAQGFDRYEGVPDNSQASPPAMQRRADVVVDDAIRWLDTIGSSRFLLWAHLYDPHRPYEPPEPFKSTYGHDPYMGEIAFVDSQIARLTEALEQRKLLDRVVLVIVGDHGEALGDHGERDHGIFVYEEVLRVPLLIRSPGMKPARVGAVVRLTDIMPTVLDLLGMPVVNRDGVSLRGLMDGTERNSELEAYSESMYPERLGWSPLHALRLEQFKLIDAPRPELYDLDRDPFERQNIYDDRRKVADAMTSRIRTILEGSRAGNTLSTVSPEVQAQLAALGYVASAVPSKPSDGTGRPDPKDCIGAYSRRPDAIPVNPICRPTGPPR